MTAAPLGALPSEAGFVTALPIISSDARCRSRHAYGRTGHVRPVRVLLPQYRPCPGRSDDGSEPGQRTSGDGGSALPRLRVLPRHPAALRPAAAGCASCRARAHPAPGSSAGCAAGRGRAAAARDRPAAGSRYHPRRDAARRAHRARRQPSHGRCLMPTLSKVLEPIGETCPADLSAAEAVRRLNTSGADALLVEKDGGIVGLFGHREAIAAFADGSGRVDAYMRRPLPGRNIADSLESGADIMYREDTPVVLMTEDEGPLFRKTSRTVGIVSAHAVLTEIGKTTTDKIGRASCRERESGQEAAVRERT